jgi:hypothetical protein
MTVADAPQQRPRDREPVGASATPGLRWLVPRLSPLLWTVIACFALAALSAVLLPTVASYDPWSWIVWGREVVDPHLSFSTGGGPSWKPLPVIFTTVYGLLGGAAPTLWVITARAGGLLGLVGAWRLAARLTTGGMRKSEAESSPGAGAGGWLTEARLLGAIAGLVAVLGIVLTQDYVYYWFRGTSEPMLIATSVWAVDRFLDGRRGQAFVIGVLGGLMRPEWTPFLIAYGIWLWFKEPRLRVLVVAGLLAIPLFWFVPPWIGSGQPFLAASHAREYNGQLGSHPVLTALGRAVNLQVKPISIAAVVAVVVAWFRRDWVVLGLAAAALAWIALVVAMVIDHYPGLERFFLPASALVCVLGGVGVARVGEFASMATGRVHWLGATARTVLVPAFAAAALIALSIPFASGRISSARAQEPLANRAVTALNQLTAAVKAVGGHDGVYPCRSSFAAVNHSVQTALAWKLHVTLGRVGTSMRHPGLDFIGPHNTINGGVAPVARDLVPDGVVARVGQWTVVRYIRPGEPTTCVGGPQIRRNG